MSRHTFDMSNEQEAGAQEVFNEGWHDFEIVTMDEMTSKQGNPMFKIHLVLAEDASKGIIVYAISTEGKRWFLKQLLNACACEAGQDGIYDFDTNEIVGHTVSGRIENSQENWKDRTGKERTSTKSKVVEFAKMGVDEKNPPADEPDL